MRRLTRNVAFVIALQMGTDVKVDVDFARKNLQLAGNCPHAVDDLLDGGKVLLGLFHIPPVQQDQCVAGTAYAAQSAGWFSSCVIPADICPSTAIFPAWISSFCVVCSACWPDAVLRFPRSGFAWSGFSAEVLSATINSRFFVGMLQRLLCGDILHDRHVALTHIEKTTNISNPNIATARALVVPALVCTLPKSESRMKRQFACDMVRPSVTR